MSLAHTLRRLSRTPLVDDAALRPIEVELTTFRTWDEPTPSHSVSLSSFRRGRSIDRRQRSSSLIMSEASDDELATEEPPVQRSPWMRL